MDSDDDWSDDEWLSNNDEVAHGFIPNEQEPIIRAAYYGDVNGVYLELEAGVSPNFRGGAGNTPLHAVCLGGSTAFNDVGEFRDRDDDIRLEQNLIECAMMLLEAGASPNLRSDDGATTLSVAVGLDHSEVLKLLLESGGAEVVNATGTGAAGWTVLGQAASKGDVDCCSYLLAAGADVNLRVINDSLNLSPLQLAMRDLPRNPDYSWSRENPNKRRVYALLVANGATIPPDGADADDAYLCKVRAAGGFPAYEMAHRMRLTATCARVVFPRLPVDAVSHVVAFAFHTGYY